MSDFLAFAREHGLLVDHVVDDGRVHRVKTVEKPTKRNGAYLWDGRSGWVQDWQFHPAPVAFRPERPEPETRQARLQREAERRRREAKERAERQAAAKEAEQVIARCMFGEHAYLAAKGFPTERGLIDIDGRLVIPMRDWHTGRVTSVQWIAADGEKRFLPNGAAKGSAFRMGRGDERWLVEGYATGLSVQAALRALYRAGEVVVTFFAGNLIHVAQAARGPRTYVFADHDASGTGEVAARATALRWCMSKEEGDANDLHQREGVRAVCELIRSVLDDP